MIKYYFILSVSLIIFYTTLNETIAQTKFDDAVALNFKNSNSGHAGFFDESDNLNTARIATKNGGYILEIGKYDDNGKYSLRRTFDLHNFAESFKMKFSSDGSKIAVLEKSPDKNVLNIFDINSGALVEDFDVENVDDFFLTPDAKYLIMTGNGNSTLYDIYENNQILVYNNETVVDMNGLGNILFCRNGNQIDYIELLTGNKIKSFNLKESKYLEFDDSGQLVLNSTQSGLNLLKLTQESIIGVKEINKPGLKPIPSPSFEYFLYDDISSGVRGVYDLGGNLIYQSKIDSYDAGKTAFVFSKDEKRLALINDKNIIVYDFELIKFYKKLAQKHPDLFISKVQFEADQDQINRADRVKIQKQKIVSNVADEMRVSANLLEQTQKNSMGLVEVKIINIEYYDPNSEMYQVTLSLPVNYTTNENVTAKIKIPKFEADIFTQNYKNFKAYAFRQLNKDLTGLDVFGITIINDLNNTSYKGLMHRTLPVLINSYEEQFNQGQKYFEQRNWYQAILNLSDFPEDFKKNSVIEFMLNQAVSNFFDEKWNYIQTLNPIRDSIKILTNLSDFPKTYKYYVDIQNLRQTTVNNIMDGRLIYGNSLIENKNYSDALDYINAVITPTYFDTYSGTELNYEYYNSKIIPLKDKLLLIIAKRSIEGGNISRANELLKQITKGFTDYTEVQKLIEETEKK